MTTNWIKWLVGAHGNGEGRLDKRRSSMREASPAAPLIDEDETLVSELTRARRYEQTLTIVVVSPARSDGSREGRSGSNGNGADGPEVLPLLSAMGLREALRESDVVSYRPTEGWFVLGLPQSDGEEARQAMARVAELFHRRLHIDLVAGAASFPADGLTLDDLERTARGRAEAVGPANPSTGSKERPSPHDHPAHRRNGRRRVSPAVSRSEIAREAPRSE